MPRKGVNIRLRGDQEEAIARIAEEMSEDKERCVAWAIELATKERLEGPPVTIDMAKAEGWYGKNGSKWKTMPELMLRYRAASFFGRLYAPEVLMGMKEESEVIDVQAETVTPIAAPTGLPPFTAAAPDPEPKKRGRKPKEPPQESPAPMTPFGEVLSAITEKLGESGYTAEQLIRVAITNNWAETTVKSLDELSPELLKTFLDNWDGPGGTLEELQTNAKPTDKPPFD